MKNKKTGLSLLEMFITLTIASLVFIAAIPSYQIFIRQSQAKVISSRLLRAINLARSEAIMHGQSVVLCKSATLLDCSGEWQNGCIILSNENKILFKFQNDTDGILHWRSFPMNQDYLQFSPSGFLYTGNGSFWYCDKTNKNPIWSIVVNQSGRARLVYPDRAGKIMDDRGKPLTC